MNDYPVALPGTTRDTTFRTFVIPDGPAIPEGVTLDVRATTSRHVPSKHDGTELYYTEFTDGPDKEVVDLIFNLTAPEFERGPLLQGYVAPHFNDVVTQAMPHNVHHMIRALHNDVTLKVIVIRLFNDGDFDCTEHPEMLLGVPMGQYHCPYCGEMQVAGLFHIKDEEHV